MMFLEPAGREGNGGDSAESSVRARAEGGPVGNTCGTVCELLAGALSAYRNAAPFPARDLSVGACLYRLFC